MSERVKQALVIDRLSRALQKIADLPTCPVKREHKYKTPTPIRARRIAIAALKGLTDTANQSSHPQEKA
jgi:hypothetical protein